MVKLSTAVALDDDPFADEDPPSRADPPSQVKPAIVEVDPATVRRISKSVCLRLAGCADEAAFDAHQKANERRQSLDKASAAYDTLSRSYARAWQAAGVDRSVQRISAAVYMDRLEPSCPDEATYNVRQRQQVLLHGGKVAFAPLTRVAAIYDNLTAVYIQTFKEIGL